MKAANTKGSHHIYVVELSKKVWTDSWRFRAANPQYNGISECLYVGITSHTPKIRFQKHKSGALSKKGHKLSSWYVENYGLYLRPSLYEQHNPMSRERAKRMEKDLSERLRRKGYAVWWN